MSTSEVRARRGLKSPPETASAPVSTEKVKKQSTFLFKAWLALTLFHWICDFGRGIYAFYVSETFPMSLPSIGDYGHMIYNVMVGFCILYLLRQCVNPVPTYIRELVVIVFVMGTSIHLVGDSVQHRLILLGYKNHLTLRENPLMQNLTPPALIQSFELLYFFDERLGHHLWYTGLFTAYFLIFLGNFGKKGQVRTTLPVEGWLLLLVSIPEQWYLVTEGQIFPMFLVMLSAMMAVLCYQTYHGRQMDSNGRWLLYRSLTILVLVGVWSAYLWNDATLKKRYPELLYVPEPWSYATLYILKQ